MPHVSLDFHFNPEHHAFEIGRRNSKSREEHVSNYTLAFFWGGGGTHLQLQSSSSKESETIQDCKQG